MPQPTPDRKSLARTALLGVAIPLAMFGAAYAAVPLYEMFCQVTGFGGTTQVATRAPSGVSAKTIEVRFDANHAPGLDVTFEPLQRAATVKLGETGLAFYRFTNISDKPVTAMATYNVTPHKTGIYFQKLQCFCFQEQTFQPGETLELPVVFYVAPELATDKDTEEVQTITLSYTFFAAKGGAIRTAEAPAGVARP
ncbi:MAG: cytochrome c oxidase assembly protein [Caulobacterales bacterium]